MVSAVIFDLDCTLTTTPSPWQHIHERLGLWENTASAYLDEWLSGRICYDEFCRRDTRLWSGRTVQEIETYLDEIGINPHVQGVAGRLIQQKIPSIIISSGFRYIASKIQMQCAWDPLLIYANELVDGPEVQINVSGDFGSPLSKRSLAAQALRQVDAAFEQTLVVSDTQRDLQVLADCRYKLLVENEDDLLKVHDFLD
jgi:phosphoserine phosphatase